MGNMRRIFGNNPTVHVYNIDTDYENYHSKFMQNFDWDREFPGSKGNFESQVRKGLQNALSFRLSSSTLRIIVTLKEPKSRLTQLTPTPLPFLPIWLQPISEQ